MSDRFEKLSNCLGADHARRIIDGERAEAEAARMMQGLQAERIRELESRDAKERRRNHHEVLCLVLKELVRSRLSGGGGIYCTDAAAAREVADLAYPPPAAEAKP